ncbi:MAG TPA: cytochrome c [Terracidiphilus sp.]|nr:cytochrome c [Terracidiphilus sp.]
MPTEASLAMVRFLAGLLLGIILVPLCVLGWFKYGKVPVAVSDPPMPMERQIAQTTLDARIAKEAPQLPPFQPNEQTYIAGARIYKDNCAFCHGFHGHPSSTGPDMFPDAPPLWEPHHIGNVVGVSDDPAGVTYWKVANGIRLTGMPSYRYRLNDTQIWQVSLLLSHANQPLPPAALQILRFQQGVPESPSGSDSDSGSSNP